MPKQHENDPKMNEIMIHRQLASLQTSVEHLTDAMKSMSSQWATQESSAASGRRALHEKFEHFRDEVGLQISGLSLRVDRVVDSVKAMDVTMTKVKPAVEKYEAEKMREEGARRLGAKLVTALTAASGVMGAAVTWGLQHWLSSGKVP
jgi:hypothetical protein